MSNTYLAHAIETTDGANTYDESVKYLLADRQILAYILKYAITEFQDQLKQQKYPWWKICILQRGPDDGSRYPFKMPVRQKQFKK